MQFKHRCRVLCATLLIIVCAIAGKVQEADWRIHDAGVQSLLVNASFADARVGWATGLCNIISTSDGGQTWSTQWSKGGADAYWFNSVVALSPQVAMVCGFPYGRAGGGIVLRTEDGGRNWKPVTAGTPGANYASMVFGTDKKTGYMLSSLDGLLVSRDAGLTWKPIATKSTVTVGWWIASNRLISLPDKNTIYTVGDHSISRSNDAGVSWTQCALPANITDRIFTHIEFASPQHGWVYLISGSVLETWDGGDTFAPSNIPGRVFFRTPQDGWAVSKENVYHSVDGGSTWSTAQKIGGGLSTPVTIAFSPTRVLVVGGSEGNGVSFITERLLPGILEKVQEDGVVIKYSLPTDRFVTIAINDAQGNRVRNLLAEQYRKKGANVDYWDGTDDNGKPVSPGSYNYNMLTRGPLKMTYEFSVATAGTPAWPTPEGTGAWLADHSPPQAVVVAGDTIAIGAAIYEEGEALIGLAPDGTKRWGSRTLSNIGGLGAQVLCSANGLIYAVSEGGWNSGVMTVYSIDPVTRNTKIVFKYSYPATETLNVWGIAVDGKRIYVSMNTRNKVVAFEDGKQVGSWDIDSPRGIAFEADHSLLVLTAEKLVRLQPATSVQTELFAGLADPYGICVVPEQQLLITERGIHTASLFTVDGKRVRTYGKAGGRQVGHYDNNTMYKPAGIALDSKGQVWIAEADFQPKRVSVWAFKEETFLREYLGPLMYGGGGFIDSTDDSTYRYQGVAYKIDWKTGKWNPSAVEFRYPYPDGPKAVPEANFWRMNGGDWPFGDMGPSRTIKYKGHVYQIMDQTMASNGVYIFEKRGERIYPLAGAGNADALPAPFKRTGQNFAWSDLNRDGLMQEVEVNYVASPVQRSPHLSWGAFWGMHVRDDLSFVLSHEEYRYETVWTLAPDSWTEDGVPVYHAADAKLIRDAYFPDKPGDPVGPNVFATFSDKQGNILLNSNPLSSISPTGKLRWTYPQDYPNVHGSMRASGMSMDGKVIGALRFCGRAVLPDGKHEVIAVLSNLGLFYLISDEGLFVATCFKDARIGRTLSLPEHQRGLDISDVNLYGELFGGSFSRLKSGEYCFVAGKAQANIISVHGLDTLAFSTGTLAVTADDLKRAQKFHDAQAAAMSPLIPTAITLSNRTGEITIDGDPKEWPDSAWSPLMTGRLTRGSFAAQYDKDNLYLCWRVRDDSPLKNTGKDWRQLFKSGDAVDIMLRTQPGGTAALQTGDIRLLCSVMDGQPLAVLYDPLGTPTAQSERLTFTSPVGRADFARVEWLRQAKVAARPTVDGYCMEAIVPLATLSLNLLKVPTTRGDVGIIFSDQMGTRNVERLYHFNNQTNIVNDIPSEANLVPGAWGELLVR